MYAIVAHGAVVEMCDAVRFIKIDPDTETYIECPKVQAQGIAATGTAYNLRGGTVIPDAPEAEYKEIDPGEVLEQTEYNRQGINLMIGVSETPIDPDEELSYHDRLLRSYTKSQEDRAKLGSIRGSLDSFVTKIVDSPTEINENMLVIRAWGPGAFEIGDVRLYEGNPYKCVQAHNSTDNENWNPTVASLWMQYHGTTPGTARAWIAPTGAHDMYRENEYIIWTDNKIYRCISDTTYSPIDYAQNWEEVGEVTE